MGDAGVVQSFLDVAELDGDDLADLLPEFLSQRSLLEPTIAPFRMIDRDVRDERPREASGLPVRTLNIAVAVGQMMKLKSSSDVRVLPAGNDKMQEIAGAIQDGAMLGELVTRGVGIMCALTRVLEPQIARGGRELLPLHANALPTGPPAGSAW